MRIRLAIHRWSRDADMKTILAQAQPLIAMGAWLRPHTQDQVRTLPDITRFGHDVSASLPTN